MSALLNLISKSLHFSVTLSGFLFCLPSKLLVFLMYPFSFYPIDYYFNYHISPHEYCCSFPFQWFLLLFALLHLPSLPPSPGSLPALSIRLVSPSLKGSEAQGFCSGPCTPQWSLCWPVTCSRDLSCSLALHPEAGRARCSRHSEVAQSQASVYGLCLWIIYLTSLPENHNHHSHLTFTMSVGPEDNIGYCVFPTTSPRRLRPADDCSAPWSWCSAHARGHPASLSSLPGTAPGVGPEPLC